MLLKDLHDEDEHEDMEFSRRQEGNAMNAQNSIFHIF